MIVDSSALVVVLRQEPDADVFDEAIATVGSARLSAANYLETALVIDGAGDPVASRELDHYLGVMRIELVPVSPAQALLARAAHRDFGRGSGHPARLNHGDCFSYALAIDTGEPLLYTGDGFAHTDVRSAVRR